MTDYPLSFVPAGGTAPVPRRIRAIRNGEVVLDTQNAVYRWEKPQYPQYYIPVADVADAVRAEAISQYDDLLRFDWDAFDAWFEEDEEVFVHPRNPYSRCDAIRSDRHVQASRDGVVLAESSSTVIVFETGLPPRYYFPRSAVSFEHLTPSGTRTACPYKGRTTGYWSIDDRDLAWSYDFPTAPLLPITGLVAFLNEHVDLTIDGVPAERPVTSFSA
ncbi:DUF427 domain-containing protein [Kribbella antibiotica]|uniref:DUF427 domain-containing protein n=1 Tax=Kribbella antibiotica TaxID=190195 RepID=A0A4R4YLW3_9ACTN|nr:DUF427 domain-containing protein [Kribbella antibiotica]TDD45936.1 DUF427 domain-containing protein [Kribbella antibiotica]